MNFSVVIPLYNKSAFVERAVRSALSQSHPPMEVLVVDDGSVDDGAQLVRGIADERVRLVQQANAGVGAARNTGLNLAQGQWVAFLDADDEWWPDHLQELAHIVSTCPEAQLVASACIEVVQGQSLNRSVATNNRARVIDYFAVAAREVGRVNSSCAAVCVQQARQIGGFSQTMRLGEDLDFWCRMACRWPVAISDKPTSVYYRATGGAMDSVQSRPATWRLLSLPEVSAPIGALLKHLEVCTDKAQRQSIIHYINSRVNGTIQTALWTGQVAFARHLAALMIEPVQTHFKCWRAFAHLPAWAWIIASHIRAGLRKAKRLFRRANKSQRIHPS